jgi:hypothetical protein
MTKFGMQSFHMPTPYELHAFLANAKNYHRNIFLYAQVNLTSMNGSYVGYKRVLNSVQMTEFSMLGMYPMLLVLMTQQ